MYSYRNPILKGNYERFLAGCLERQAPGLQGAAKDILKQLESIQNYVYWAFDDDDSAYYAQNLLEHAHGLVDLAHAFKIALAANPPPKDEDDAA